MLLTIFHLGKKIEQLSMSTFSSPFHWTVWLCLLILSIGISTVLWISHNFSRNWKELNYIEAFCIVFHQYLVFALEMPMILIPKQVKG